MKFIIAVLCYVVTLTASAGCDKLYAYGKPVVTTAESVTYLCHKMYAVEYSPSRRTPYWSAEQLTNKDMSLFATRINAFRADPDLPKKTASTPSDYDKSGYDKGHMSPVGDMHIDRIAMLESFYMSNMVPHVPENNRVRWRALEMYVRELAADRGLLYVITGPIYDGNPKTIGKNKVAVPARLYKIIIDPSIHTSLTFIVPNSAIINSGLSTFVSTLSEASRQTGIEFAPDSAVPLTESTQMWTSSTSN